MRLLIVVPEAKGHHLALYTRLLLQEAVARGWAVTILTSKFGSEHSAFDLIAADHQEPPRTIVMPDVRRSPNTGSTALFLSQLRLWNALRSACRENSQFSGFDLIYCVNLDYFEKALSLFGSPFGNRPFTGMLMNPKFHRAPTGLGPPSRADFVYRLMFKRLLAIRGLRRLLVIDGPFCDFCRQRRFAHADKISLVSDVGELSRLETRSSARASLGVASDAFVILVYGSLTRRKGIEQLLRALEKLGDPDVIVLVAGKPDEEVTTLLSSKHCRQMQESGQLLVRGEFHDDEAEVRVFSAATVVWLGYIGGAYGSSGVLYQAGSAGLPVISMADGLVGWSVRSHELGIALDASDATAVADALRRLRKDESLLREFGESGRRLARGHTGTAFATSICDALASCVQRNSVNDSPRDGSL